MTTEPTNATVASADGTLIAYTRRGEGPAVILVDPVMMHRGYTALMQLGDALADGCTVVTYDRRGRGESFATEDYSPDKEVADLAALAAELGTDVTLYGFSSGATLALRAASQLSGLKGVIAAEPARDADPDVRPELQQLIDAGDRQGAIALFNRHIGLPDEVAAQMPTEAAEPTAHTIVNDLQVLRETPVESYAKIVCPALVLLSEGSQEPIVGWAKDAAAHIERGELRTLPGGWHGFEPEALLSAVREFVGARGAGEDGEEQGAGLGMSKMHTTFEPEEPRA